MDYVTYDELKGPDLDPAHWEQPPLPLPDGSEHVPLDPTAELAVGDGKVRVTIPRLSLSHDEFQAAESVKVPDAVGAPARAAAGSACNFCGRPRS